MTKPYSTPDMSMAWLSPSITTDLIVHNTTSLKVKIITLIFIIIIIIIIIIVIIISIIVEVSTRK